MPSNVYIAGKVAKNGFRNRLVQGLRNHQWNDGILSHRNFNYVGPFFVSCDHGCFHNPGSHGVIMSKELSACPHRDKHEEFDFYRNEISEQCIRAILRSDLVFCYIDSPDCYGTLVEIGYAIAGEIPLVIVFAPGLASLEFNEFWFACAFAKQVIYDVTEDELKIIFNDCLRRWTWSL